MGIKMNWSIICSTIWRTVIIKRVCIPLCRLLETQIYTVKYEIWTLARILPLGTIAYDIILSINHGILIIDLSIGLRRRGLDFTLFIDYCILWIIDLLICLSFRRGRDRHGRADGVGGAHVHEYWRKGTVGRGTVRERYGRSMGGDCCRATVGVRYLTMRSIVWCIVFHGKSHHEFVLKARTFNRTPAWALLWEVW